MACPVPISISKPVLAPSEQTHPSPSALLPPQALLSSQASFSRLLCPYNPDISAMLFLCSCLVLSLSLFPTLLPSLSPPLSQTALVMSRLLIPFSLSLLRSLAVSIYNKPLSSEPTEDQASCQLYTRQSGTGCSIGARAQQLPSVLEYRGHCLAPDAVALSKASLASGDTARGLCFLYPGFYRNHSRGYRLARMSRVFSGGVPSGGVVRLPV